MDIERDSIENSSDEIDIVLDNDENVNPEQLMAKSKTPSAVKIVNAVDTKLNVHVQA